MRYSCIHALLLALILSVSAIPAFAQGGFHGPGPGGFQGPTSPRGFHGRMAQAKVTTVASALKARDDTHVTLTGHIVRRMPNDDDDYLFRDATGTIVVDIDHKIFQGRTVNPRTRVRIFGKVDTHKRRPNSIDVKFLEIL